MDTPRLETLAILTEQMRTARDQYETASAKFSEYCAEAPSGIPGSDGSLRIRLAGRDSRAALERYMESMKRFSDFTLHNIVPSDLKEK